MDLIFHRGGPCIPECMPVCEGCRETTRARHTPYPERVAGEYHRGEFTLGWRFHPGEIQYQETAITCAPAGLAIGDFVSLINVPNEHVVRDVFLKITPEHTQFATSRSMPNVSHRKNNMVGLIVSVAIKRFTKDGVFIADIEAPAATQDVASPPKPVGNAPQQNVSIRAALSPTTGGLYVPTGEYLEIGFVIEALPTVNPYGAGPFPMELVSGFIELAAKVGDYQTPLHG